jgi:hypothetical protein
MTRDVKYCFEDEDVDDVARNMCQVQGPPSSRRQPRQTPDRRYFASVMPPLRTPQQREPD